MYLAYLKQNTYAAFAIYLLTLLALWAPRLFWDFNIAADSTMSQMPLQAFLLDWLHIDEQDGRWLACIFTYLNACLLWGLNVRHIFLKANEHLLPLCYIIMASAVPETQVVFASQVAVSLLLLGTHYLFSAYQQKPGLAPVFMAAFCFSLASLFFSPAASLLVLLPIAILVVHSFAWRNWIALLSGVATPYLYVFFYYWLWEGDNMKFVSMINEHILHTTVSVSMPNAPHFIYLAVFILLLLVSLLSVFSRNSSSKVKVMHCYAIFEWMLLFLIAGAICYPASKYLTLPLTAVPAAVLVASYAGSPHGKKTRTSLLLLYIAAIIVVQLF